MPTFAPLKNDTFLRALSRQPTEYMPVWLMRQAGRYHPEYRSTRARAGSFMALATNPDYATEVTLQPLARYPLDAAILFSDILTVPDAMALGLSFHEGEGPAFRHRVDSEMAMSDLWAPGLASLQYVFDVVTQIWTELNGRVPLIGFAGSRWTLACYMVEGKGSRDFHEVKKMLYGRPDMADVLRQLKREKDGVKIPVIVFTKGGGHWIGQIADTGADAIGLDWSANLANARLAVGDRVALQGNLEPAILFASESQIRTEVRRVLNAFGIPADGCGHVFNLGHGISQYAPPDNVAAMVDEVHSYSRTLHAEANVVA